VVISLDCFRRGSTFATHNTPGSDRHNSSHTTYGLVLTTPTNTHYNRHDFTTPWINQHTFNLPLYTLLYNLLSVAGASVLLIHWQAHVLPDGYQHFIHLFLWCKLGTVTNSSLYTEHMVEGDWKKEKQKRSGLHKEWHTTGQIQSIRPTSKTSAKTMHALKMTKFKNRLENAFYFYYFQFLFPILVPLIHSLLS